MGTGGGSLEGEMGILEKKEDELVATGAGSSVTVAEDDKIVCSVYGVYGIRDTTKGIKFKKVTHKKMQASSSAVILLFHLRHPMRMLVLNFLLISVSITQ